MNHSGAMAGLLAFLVALPGTTAAQQEQQPAIQTLVARLASAEAQLAHARSLRQRMFRASSEERAMRLEGVLEALRAVRIHYPADRRAGAEACYHAGRLLSTRGREEEALRELDLGCALGRGTEWCSRGLLEIGRIHRRAGRLQPALDAFLAVSADPTAPRSDGDEAWLEVGSLWHRQGKTEDACRAWTRVAHHGNDPLDRIRAFDRLGLAWVDAGDLEAAGGVLHQCLQELSPLALEETEIGERVRRALERMLLVRALQRGVQARRDSSQG